MLSVIRKSLIRSAGSSLGHLGIVDMGLSTLRPGMEKLDLTVRIAGLKATRKVETSYGVTHILLEGEVEDESGRMDLTVWNEKIDDMKMIDVGDEVRLTNCFVTSFRGVLSLNVGRDSEIKKATDVVGDAP